MHHYKIHTSRGGVSAHVMAPDKFAGEYARRSWRYVSCVWLVSILALVTNLAEAIYRKSVRGGTLGEVLWKMGRDPKHVSGFFADRFSRYNHQAKYGAAGWRSLDLFYNYHEKVKPKLGRDIEGWLTRQWIGKCENRQAVTNRLKIAVELIAKSFDDFAGEPEIRLLSIASGSAQAVVEAMKQRPDLNIKVVLIDFDESALHEARKLVQQSGLEHRFSYRVDTTKALETAAGAFKPHIVEMIGFLDYRPRSKAIGLIARIRRQLPEGGFFLTCNIHHNREKIFLDWILLWPMIYRTDAEFADLVVEGGFEPDKVQVVYEPFRIHGIAVCRK
ncbi:MAG: class I SAM-dependent methyltransferase family protein [Rhodocyclales bacterium]|nr:class I SAM-dependent methyltransferase family protein [Rhodocyclales bacterium]